MHQRNLINLLAGAAIAPLAVCASALPDILPRKDLEVGAKPVKPVMNPILLSNNGNIFIATCNGTDARIVHKQKVTGNPSWMAYMKPNLLYAVDENSANTSLYHADLANNKIDFVQSQKGSNGVVHLEIKKDTGTMVGSAYGSSGIDVWSIANGGLSLVKTIPVTDKIGQTSYPDRQDKPHPHEAVLDPTGRYFIVNDLGTDKMLVLDSKTNEIVNRVDIGFKSFGPRHGVFYPLGAKQPTHYILLCEIKNRIVVFDLRYNEKNGIEFGLVQGLSSFGDVYAMPRDAAAGEIVISPTGKDIYVSNRLTGKDMDNIAHFRVVSDPSGGVKGSIKLEWVAFTPSYGRLPRMMSVSVDGKYLFVGNQDGQNGFVALNIDTDGRLGRTPAAVIPLSEFGGEKAGPAFVKQINLRGC